MHNIDEQVPYDSSRPHPYLYNVLGCFFSVLIGFGIFWLFRGYFYGAGLNEVLPSILLLIGSFIVGFGIAKWIFKKKSVNKWHRK